MGMSKEAAQRKTEILDAAEKLFTTKGYANTTINDILHEVEIAKGTFYYYFTSKKEVMNAVVDRFVDLEVNAAKAVKADQTLSAPEKILKIIMGQNQHELRKEKMIEELHVVGNAEMHQKSLTETILKLTPILTDVIEQGISEGVFATPYPKETIEILLVSASFIFDEGVFQWTPEEKLQKASAFIYILENVLAAKKGSFQYLLKKLSR